jgi:hypothetical protein
MRLQVGDMPMISKTRSVEVPSGAPSKATLTWSVPQRKLITRLREGGRVRKTLPRATAFSGGSVAAAKAGFAMATRTPLAAQLSP